METALVMAQEARAAADLARDNLIDDLATLEGRLSYEVTSIGLITPEAIGFADALMATLAKRDAEAQELIHKLNSVTSELNKKANVEVSNEPIC